VSTEIDLTTKSPLELKRLLDLVKTGPLSVQEKDVWVEKIEKQLGTSPKNADRERRILADYYAGMADMDGTE